MIKHVSPMPSKCLIRILAKQETFWKRKSNKSPEQKLLTSQQKLGTILKTSLDWAKAFISEPASFFWKVIRGGEIEGYFQLTCCYCRVCEVAVKFRGNFAKQGVDLTIIESHKPGPERLGHNNTNCSSLPLWSGRWTSCHLNFSQVLWFNFGLIMTFRRPVTEVMTKLYDPVVSVCVITPCWLPSECVWGGVQGEEIRSNPF